uniref:Uncharacterized protein n=1 Tax=Arundo donax TaxID=35708 RepID=A0A0A8YU26_ARUDO
MVRACFRMQRDWDPTRKFPQDPLVQSFFFSSPSPRLHESTQLSSLIYIRNN